MKLLLIGGLLGLVIGVVVTVLYFSLATFFAANAKALNNVRKTAENATKNTDHTIVTKKRKAHAG